MTENPNYYNIGDHSETVRVDYDPSVVSYEQLLEAFWGGHDSTYPSYSRQYRSAIFFINEEQEKLAIDSGQREEAQRGRSVFTDIEPLTQFYTAEDSHQKYYLRGAPDLMAEMSVIYPNTEDLMNSTAAARLNGYVSGYGDESTLLEHMDKLGLSESGKQKLLEIAVSGLAPACPIR